MRICFIVRALPVHRLGGLEHHAHDLAAALARRGHQVYILTTVGGSAEKIPGVPIHEIPGTKPGDYSLGFFRHVAKAARELCRLYEIEILCPIDLSGLFLKPNDFNACVIPLIHGTMTSEVPLDWRYRQHLPPPQKLKEAWKYKTRIILASAFRKMVNRVEAICVDSEFTRRELMHFPVSRKKTSWKTGERVSRLAGKIHVAMLGIDGGRYAPKSSDPDGHTTKPSTTGVFRICLLGRLQKIKGIGQAVRMAGILRQRGVPFRMTVGGSGTYRNEGLRLVESLNLGDHVEFVGRVEPADLGRFFAQHDIFLFPDLTQPAFGLVAVEAMHYGLPVVAANVGAVPEVVTPECGWLYDPWDINEGAGLLARLAESPEEVSRKVEFAAKRNRNFTAEKMAERTETVFQELLLS